MKIKKCFHQHSWTNTLYRFPEHKNKQTPSLENIKRIFQELINIEQFDMVLLRKPKLATTCFQPKTKEKKSKATGNILQIFQTI